MVSVLPGAPLPATFVPRLSASVNDMSSPFGGSNDRGEFAGGHWVFDVQLEPMPYSQLLAWADLDNPRKIVAWPVPQPGIDTGTPGAPVVDGAGVLGAQLPVRGVTPGYVLQKGRWLSITTDGQRYLYQVDETVTANGAGNMTVALNPILRAVPADGDAVELAAPMIEGFVTTGSVSKPVDVRSENARGVSFQIEERD